MTPVAQPQAHLHRAGGDPAVFICFPLAVTRQKAAVEPITT